MEKKINFFPQRRFRNGIMRCKVEEKITNIEIKAIFGIKAMHIPTRYQKSLQICLSMFLRYIKISFSTDFEALKVGNVRSGGVIPKIAQGNTFFTKERKPIDRGMEKKFAS